MRVRRLDLAVGVAAAALGGWTASLQSGGTPAILGGVLLGASLGVLRGIPMLGFALAVAGTTLAGIDGSIADGPMALLLVASFGIGLYAGRVAGVVAVVALFAADLTHAFSADDWVPTVMFPAVFWGAGRAMRAHEVVARRLKERAAELAEEREAYAQLSVRYERARIAAELHDIVAHAISVMVVQASAGQRLAAVDPELTTQTFHVIADAARQAEDDMGRLVALLGDEPAGPAPDLALVEELVARAAGSGLDVTLRLEGTVDEVPLGHGGGRLPRRAGEPDERAALRRGRGGRGDPARRRRTRSTSRCATPRRPASPSCRAWAPATGWAACGSASTRAAARSTPARPPTAGGASRRAFPRRTPAQGLTTIRNSTTTTSTIAAAAAVFSRRARSS